MEYTVLQDYLLENVYYIDKWKELDGMEEEEERIKQAVVNDAIKQLIRELPHHFRKEEDIPMDIVAAQVLHILEMDDSHRRAEMGVSYFMASGLYVSFDKNFQNYGIARTVLAAYPKRKVGSYAYTRKDTFRKW